MSDKKVCEVCAREKLTWDSEHPAQCCGREMEPRPGVEARDCYRIGFERERAKAAILTPEVLRLIEAGRKYQKANAIYEDVRDGCHASAILSQDAVRERARTEVLHAALALPFETPAESNHTEKQQLPKKGGE